MKLLMHGMPCVRQYVVDLGKFIPVSAVNAISAFHIALTCYEGPVQQLFEPRKVYQTDEHGELIAVYD